MSEYLSLFISLVAGVAGGFFIGQKLLKKNTVDQEAEAFKKVEEIIRNATNNAENIKKDRMLEAKEYFLKLKSEFDEDSNNRKNMIAQNEQKVHQMQQQVQTQLDQNKKIETDFTIKTNSLTQQIEIASKKREEAEKMHQQQVSQLEKIANLTAEQAKQQLVEALKHEAESKASSFIKQTMEEAKLSATKEAKKIIIETIQRTAAEQAIENCVSVFNIESDEIKGKIIGREGRNIRALEAATGVEIIVDDTPEAIVISSFDPVRREVARLSMHRLVQDGRIHPARIEEIVNKTRKDIDHEVIEIGERTVIDLGIHGLHPELIKMVGRMRFRSSYGQNLLQHSREVAKLCATMAAEMGLNVKLAKRADYYTI